MNTHIPPRIAALLIGAAGLLYLPSPAEAQAPGLLNYQGRVAVTGTNFDGTGQFRFALVNATGSTTFWSSGASAVTCTVTKGLYSMLLGDTSISNMAALPATVFTNNDVRLRVWFAPLGSTPQQFTPDQRVAASGYALMAANADQLDGLHAAAFAQLSSSPTFTGTVHAAAFTGSGSGVTGVNADQVDGLHAAAFAQLSSSPTFTGTVHAAAFTGSGSGVTGVNADQLDSLHAAAFAQLSSSPTFTGTVHAGGFAGNGSSLTNVNANQLDGQHGTYYLNAANLTGTLHDACLSTNVALKNAAQNFSADNHFLAKVGIGATNPQKRLEVKVQSTADGIRVDGQGSGVSPAISLSTNEVLHGELGLAANPGAYSTDAAPGDFVVRNSGGKVLLQTGAGSSAIAIATNNYVGIHKAAPTSTLDVNGTVTANAFTGNGAGLSHVSLVCANGKTLTVGRNYGDGPLEVYGSTWTLDQQNNNFGYYFHGATKWQSFTAGTNGSLIAAQTYIDCYTGGVWSGTFNVYAGEGTTGALLSSQAVQGDSPMQLRTITLETPVPLTHSNQYTLCFYNCSAAVHIHGSGNTYSGGRSDDGAYDWNFYTYMLATAQAPILVVQPNTHYIGIGTATPTNTLHVNGTVQALAYITGSDRHSKENIKPVSPEEILAEVSSLPIARWNFKEDRSGSHIGPMAQDFHTAFGLGNTDSGIFTVDADGVALAAIQGLNQKLDAALQAKDDEITRLKSRVEQLEKLLHNNPQAPIQ